MYVNEFQVVLVVRELIVGPPFCNDVVIDKVSGLAFLACDPFKSSFYPPYELSNLSRVYGSGGIWLYDTNVMQFILSLTVGCIVASNQITIPRKCCTSAWIPPSVAHNISRRKGPVSRTTGSRKNHAITRRIIP